MHESENVTPEIDRFIHEPARLAILTVLAACQRADFLFLERATGLTRGNLSVQLTRLEGAHLITVEKTIKRKRTLTTAALLPLGRTGLDAYWRTMDELRGRAQPAAAAAPLGAYPCTVQRAGPRFKLNQHAREMSG